MSLHERIEEALADDEGPPPGVCCFCGELIGDREACRLFAVSNRRSDRLHELSAHVECFQRTLDSPLEYDF